MSCFKEVHFTAWRGILSANKDLMTLLVVYLQSNYYHVLPLYTLFTFVSLCQHWNDSYNPLIKGIITVIKIWMCTQSLLFWYRCGRDLSETIILTRTHTRRAWQTLQRVKSFMYVVNILGSRITVSMDRPKWVDLLPSWKVPWWLG